MTPLHASIRAAATGAFALLLASPLAAQTPAPTLAGPLADVALGLDHAAEIEARRADDERLQAAAEADGLFLEKVDVLSRRDGLKIPTYHFAPRDGASPAGALVWVYGGIHDRFGTNYYPFIREAVSRGFRVVAPEYRGARGYGAEFYGAMDYGGAEVDDALAAADFAAERLEAGQPVQIIGWSHGGLISLLAASRDPGRFSGVVASVPVVNLVTRMAYKGPEYHALFAESPHIGGPVHKKLDAYLARSPQYQLDSLRDPSKVRVQVQAVTNDDDVAYLEVEPFIHTLRQKIGERADLHVFASPPHGHYFNRRVDLQTLTRRDTPAQVQSWRAIWRFLEAGE